MSRCCSVSFSISLLGIFSFLAQLNAGQHTFDQKDSIPLPDIVESNPNSSVIDTYSYFCHDYNTTEIFNDFVQCDPQMRKVVVPPLYCLTYSEEMSMFLAGNCPFLPNAKEIKSVYLPENITNVATFNEEVMCHALNRKGVSCGKCNDNSAVAVNSYSSECELHWKPGTAWSSKWKPHLRLYISASNEFQETISHFYNELLPQLEYVCRDGGASVSPIHISCQGEKYSLNEGSVLDLCLEEISKCDIFLSFIGSDIDTITKLQVEHGFLNNPTIKPTVFVFTSPKSGSVATNATKLKQRIRKNSDRTIIIEGYVSSDDMLQQLFTEINNILKTSYEILEQQGDEQEDTFAHLTLLADMKMEYEQCCLLNTTLDNSSQKPVGIDITFDSLEAYMNDEGTVAPFLITAPPGSGKSVLLAKWIEKLQQENSDRVAIIHHFVSHSCSISTETSLMYRRFCLKLIHLYGESYSSFNADPNKLEECFSDWLNKTAANLGNSGPEMLFFVIDNSELLLDHSQLGWLHKPLPKNVRVVMTTTNQYPESWRSLASCTLPTVTKTDVQQIISEVRYGPRNRNLTDDQALSLTISASLSSLWSVLAAKYIISISSDLSESELDEVIESLENVQEVPELVDLMITDFESKHQSIGNAIEQILQLMFWSRNGLSLCELKQLLQFPDVVTCYIVNEFENKQMLHEVGGLLQFTNEQVTEGIQLKYELDSSPEQLLMWSQPLITLFSDLHSQLLIRCIDELPWLLKRGELHQELANVLLNVDILIQLYCSGQGASLFKYWEGIGVFTADIPEQYRKELDAIEEQAGNDQSPVLYVAMVLLTVGKILHNLGLLDKTQLLLQRGLELYESHCDPDSKEVAYALCELARLYTSLQRFSAAESFYKQALEIYEHPSMEYSDQVMNVLDALKRIYRETKRPQLQDGVSTRLLSLRDEKNRSKPTAHSLLKHRVQILEQTLVNLDDSYVPSITDIQSLNEWAVIHAAFGDDNLAEGYLYAALNSSEEVLGEDHPQTLVILKNVVTLYVQTNKLSDAITVQGRIVELKEKENGDDDDISLAAAVNNLAVFHSLLGEYANALPFYDRAIEIYSQHYGTDHSRVQGTIANRNLAAENL